MRIVNRVGLAVILVAFVLSSPTWAGGKGGRRNNGNNDKDHKPSPFDTAIDFILEHSEELKITPDQTTKLGQLQELYAKYSDDPAFKTAIQDLRHARNKGTAQEAAEANRRVSAKLKEKSGGLLGGLQADLGRILSADQMKKYTELRSGAAPATEPGADAPKLPPNPFEP